MNNLLKVANTSNLVPGMNDSWCFTLSAHQDNVDQLCRRCNCVHLFKIVDWHGGSLVRFLLFLWTSKGMMIVTPQESKNSTKGKMIFLYETLCWM